MNRTTSIMAIAVVAAFVMGTLIAGNVAEAGNPVKNLELYIKQLDRMNAKLTGTIDEIGTGPFTQEEALPILVGLGRTANSADEIKVIANDAGQTVLNNIIP